MNKLNEIKNRSISYLSFRIGDEEYASHVSHVENIVEVPRITQIPNAPDYLKGVINLRGQVLPVVDTRIRFGMSPAEITPSTCILVLDIETEEGVQKVGGIVDSVHEVLELQEEEIMPPPRIGKLTSHSFITGMAKRKEEFILVVDMNLLFSDGDLRGFTKQLEEIKSNDSA